MATMQEGLDADRILGYRQSTMEHRSGLYVVEVGLISKFAEEVRRLPRPPENPEKGDRCDRCPCQAGNGEPAAARDPVSITGSSIHASRTTHPTLFIHDVAVMRPDVARVIRLLPHHPTLY